MFPEVTCANKHSCRAFIVHLLKVSSNSLYKNFEFDCLIKYGNGNLRFHQILAFSLQQRCKRDSLKDLCLKPSSERELDPGVTEGLLVTQPNQHASCYL